MRTLASMSPVAFAEVDGGVQPGRFDRAGVVGDHEISAECSRPESPRNRNRPSVKSASNRAGNPSELGGGHERPTPDREPGYCDHAAQGGRHGRLDVTCGEVDEQVDLGRQVGRRRRQVVVRSRVEGLDPPGAGERLDTGHGAGGPVHDARPLADVVGDVDAGRETVDGGHDARAAGRVDGSGRSFPGRDHVGPPGDNAGRACCGRGRATGSVAGGQTSTRAFWVSST